MIKYGAYRSNGISFSESLHWYVFQGRPRIQETSNRNRKATALAEWIVFEFTSVSATMWNTHDYILLN